MRDYFINKIFIIKNYTTFKNIYVDVKMKIKFTVARQLKKRIPRRISLLNKFELCLVQRRVVSYYF